MNDFQYIVGAARVSIVTRPVRWQENSGYTPQDLGALGTLANHAGIAYGIDASGRVVGDSTTLNNVIHAFRTQGGDNAIAPVDDLGTLSGVATHYSTARAISKFGETVGASQVNGYPNKTNAFFVRGNSTTMQNIDVLQKNFSIALGINQHGGYVVGYFLDAGGNQRACLWYPYAGVMKDLNDFLSPIGWTLLVANGVNNDGYITGWGIESTYYRAFLFKPVF